MKRILSNTFLILADQLIGIVGVFSSTYGIYRTDDTVFYVLGGFLLGAVLSGIYKFKLSEQ